MIPLMRSQMTECSILYRQPDSEIAPSRDSEITAAYLRRTFRHKLEVTWMQDLLGPHHDGTAVQQLVDLLQSVSVPVPIDAERFSSSVYLIPTGIGL